MLLSGVLFALFLAGAIAAGAIAWLTARKLARARRRPSATVDHLALASLGDANVRWYVYRPMTSGADAALGRHPAGRSRMAGRLAPRGPDDDPEFLRALARRIHGDPPA
jgi:hypothetical protein